MSSSLMRQYRNTSYAIWTSGYAISLCIYSFLCNVDLFVGFRLESRFMMQ